jgi:DNA-binding transcriptional MerR regulator
MRIGELAKRTGVSERSLRYYEKQGLLTAERTLGGHRDYPDGAVDRVILIQELFAAGLHSKKIVQLLPCMRDADGGPSEIATARLVNDLVAERDRIDRMMVDLVRARDVLDEVIDAASDSPLRAGTHRGDRQPRALPGSGSGTGEAAISRS